MEAISSVVRGRKDATQDPTIDNRQSKGNKFTTIDNSNNSQLSGRVVCKASEVDRLLDLCKDLIDPKYKSWFAEQMYKCHFGTVLRLAALADRPKVKNKQRYFTWLIKKHVAGEEV